MSSVYKFGGSSELEKEQFAVIDKKNNDFVLRDGRYTLTVILGMGINKVSTVADPVDAQDAATKKYVDNVKEYVKNTAMTLIQNPGKRLIISTEDGNVVDSDLSVEDIIKKSAISEFLIPKLQSPAEGKLLMLTAEGNVIESDLSIEDIVQKSIISEFAIPKLQSPTGGKLLMSTANGNIIVFRAQPSANSAHTSMIMLSRITRK